MTQFGSNQNLPPQGPTPVPPPEPGSWNPETSPPGQPPYGPVSPVYSSPPPRRRTAWLAVAVTMGCLAPLIVGLLVVSLLAPRLWQSGLLRSAPPSGASITLWNYNYRTLPPEVDLAEFQSALQSWVLETQGEQAARDLGRLKGFTAQVEFASSGDEGIAEVDLTSAAPGRAAKIFLSFQRQDDQWSFTLNAYQGP